jgi:hypothetical protein
MDERARQILRIQLQAVVIADALMEVGDIDLWLEANDLATRTVMAARIRRANGSGPHEDGQGHTT